MWKYKLGTVVKHNPSRDVAYEYDYGWGHITGFSENAFGETILVVKWADGKEFPIHNSNVLTEEDEK